MWIYWTKPPPGKPGKQPAGVGGSVPRRGSRRLRTSRGALYPATCWVCGRDVAVSFQPNRLRPVYCAKHLKEVRQGSRPVPQVYLTRSWEFAQRRANHINRKYRLPFVAGAVVLVLLSSFVLKSFITEAETTQLYPSVCLGDWYGPNSAVGAPETEAPGIEFVQFNDTNSAVYNGGEKSLFCSSFVGEPPEVDSVTEVRLRLVWAGNSFPMQAPVSQPADEVPTEPADEEILEAPSLDAESGGAQPEAPSTELPASETLTPETPELPVESSQPVSLWPELLPAALAQESETAGSKPEAVSSEPAAASEESSAEPLPETAVEPAAESSELVPEAAVEPQPIISTPLTEQNLEDPERFLVKYSLDGQEWFPLAYLKLSISKSAGTSSSMVPLKSLVAVTLRRIV